MPTDDTDDGTDTVSERRIDLAPGEVDASYLGRVGHGVTVGLHGQSYSGVERTSASLFQLHDGPGRPSRGRVTPSRK